MTVAARVIGPEKWLGNEEIDAFMYIWRVKTSLRHWTLDYVAFIPTYFYLQIEKAYLSFTGSKIGYVLGDIILAYWRGELPSHGRTNKVFI
ncbi:unnamed protein product [Eruca vesicaria subsp. sativa]|uniref:Uncharacterized protein n=1 Tax=Eruca vesicaria subsp. sativa TaxID=29727 RepID=A0ABC8JS37_ERUVS|nr:unnamed protein product [Eruca vesicaria subsp. sativa]